MIEFDFMSSTFIKPIVDGESFSGIYEVEYLRDKVKGIPTSQSVLMTLTRKSPEWAYEKEWRVIRSRSLLKLVAKDVYVADIAPTAIKRIILGSKFSDKEYSEVREALSKKDLQHVVVEKAVVKPDEFALDTMSMEKYAWTLFHRDYHFEEYAEEALMCIPMEK